MNKWEQILKSNNKTEASILDDFRINQLKSDINNKDAWESVCVEYEFSYVDAFVNTEMTSKFRRVLNDMHLLCVFGSHSFPF